jgi:hypothetical protein
MAQPYFLDRETYPRVFFFCPDLLYRFHRLPCTSLDAAPQQQQQDGNGDMAVSVVYVYVFRFGSDPHSFARLSRDSKKWWLQNRCIM